MDRPSPADLLAARDRTLPDVVAPGLRVLFCGINPGLYTAWAGHHFARPGNRFWPALHRSGFTARQLHPSEQAELLPLGLGITNVVERATATADELTRDELVAGGRRLTADVERWRPAWLAVLGVTAYRTAFAEKTRGRRPPGSVASVRHGSGCCPTRAGSTRTGRPPRSPAPSPSSARRSTTT